MGLWSGHGLNDAERDFERLLTQLYSHEGAVIIYRYHLFGAYEVP